MRLKLSIKQKIQFYVLTFTILVFVLAFGYIGTSTKSTILDNTVQYVNIQSEKEAFEMSYNINRTMNVVTTLSQMLESYEVMEWEKWEKLLLKVYEDVIADNPQIFSLWDSWEYNVIDSTYKKPYGRKVIIFWNEDGVIKHSIENKSMDGDPEQYGEIKRDKKPCVWEPYFDLFANSKSERLLMTTVNMPIKKDGKYVGIIAADITLKKMQEDIKNIKPLKGSYAYVVSHGGIIAAHPNTKIINKKINELFEKEEEKYNIVRKIQQGETFSYISTDDHGEEVYVTYAPIFIQGVNTPWSLAISIPVNTITEEANRKFFIALGVVLLGIIVIAIIIFYIGKNISEPIKYVTNTLVNISKGHINKDMRLDIKTGDEIEQMADALNISVKGLLQKQEFAEQIGQGKLDNEIELLSQEDSLGKSLNSMQSNLFEAKKEDEKRKEEDEKQNWITQGQAQFAEILRQYNDNMDMLGAEIIKNLVKYMSANQGGVFLMKEREGKDPYLELISAYAYNRPKLMRKQIEIGEGLIGTCVQEKETTYVTDVPKDYIEITSGLGGATPNALLMVPLVIEDKMLGAIEVASFKNFEGYEIKFVENVAKSIAATINTVQINLKTTELLRHTQEQAQEMKEQEEEMRQNMEELKATQEEAARKGAEMEGLIKAINISSFVIEYDMAGYITNLNDNYLDLLKITKNEAVGTHHADGIEFIGKDKEEYNSFWAELELGNVQKQNARVTINGEEHLFTETYTPIKNLEGKVYKVLKISNLIEKHTS